MDDWYEIEVILFLQPDSANETVGNDESVSKYFEDLVVPAPEELDTIDVGFKLTTAEQALLKTNSRAIELEGGDNPWFIESSWISPSDTTSMEDPDSQFGVFPSWLLPPGESYDAFFELAFHDFPFAQWFVELSLASLLPVEEEEILSERQDSESNAELEETPEILEQQRREEIEQQILDFREKLKRGAFTMDEDQVRLPRTGQRLGSGGAHILRHFNWYQFVPSLNSKPMRVFFQSIEDELTVEGYFQISKGRYLHLDVHLWLHQDQRTNEIRAPVYELEESRRIRRSEVHYFDHPKFGLLAEVVKVGLPNELQTLIDSLD